jgi:hypothetical protein
MNGPFTAHNMKDSYKLQEIKKTGHRCLEFQCFEEGLMRGRYFPAGPINFLLLPETETGNGFTSVNFLYGN